MTHHILKYDNKSLHTLRQFLAQLAELNALLARCLDEELAKHCQVMKFEKNCLFVMTTNGAWLTQLRFQIPDLIIQLKQHALLSQLSGIICKARPAVSHHHTLVSTKKRVVNKLSVESAGSLLEAARTIKDDRLRNILEKIARYVK